MAPRERIELAPEIVVLDGFPVRGLPAVAFPAVDPRLYAVLDVLRIGVELDFARPFQRLERADDGGQLHPVVGRRGLAAEELLLVIPPHEQCAPAARSRISFASAI